MIPDEAVEAAARVIADRDGHPTIWDYDAETARTVLEAAAPHMLSHEREETRLAHLDAVVNAQTVDKLNKAIIAVNKILDEKYRLWAAICGNTCSKDVLGVDHDAIADEVGNVIRAAMAEALSK